MTALMPIPGHVDPVPVPRAPFASDDARVDLVGLSRDAIRASLEEAGLDVRQAKLRSKQIWHQIYNRGATEFDAMSDIAKPQRAWLAERFVVGRPDVVVSQVSTDGTRKWLLKIDDRTFQLLAGGRDAWAQDGRADAEIVAAMRTGVAMTVETRSERGAFVRDNYGLAGAATAIDAAAIACAKRG